MGDEGVGMLRVRDQDWAGIGDLGGTCPFLPDPAGFGCLTQTYREPYTLSHISLSLLSVQNSGSQFASATCKKKMH